MAKKRYLVIVIVCIIALATSMLAGCGEDDLSPTAEPTNEQPTSEPTPEPLGDLYIQDGNYIYFGSYPQSEVTDETLKESLTNAAGDTSTWTSYDYYYDGEISGFMVYKIVNIGSEKYRGVYFTKYRPWLTFGSNMEEESSVQDDNGYYTNNVYWFKYEPIKWKILSMSNGDAFLLADQVLDSQDYHYTRETTNGYHANNYEHSHLRSWLNDQFYNIAFSDREKEIIKTTLVDNSINSLGPDYGHSSVCNDTNDKIFLLSYSEATNDSYGFSDNYDDQGSNRVARPTAYAMSQGITVFSGTCWWWLRSPGHDSDCVAGVNTSGHIIASGCIVYDSSCAVRPALHLDIG